MNRARGCPPAIRKTPSPHTEIITGWVQRVLVSGVAYKLGTSDGEPQGLLKAGRLSP
ncbi:MULTISPECIES: hypothetical protein [unclassified Streptomyces]|uniref:hypothetical protein n=1 Tax=unclassified Streptomyces TaxID=2593676 RepID=UPI00380F2768|nr:hypothetical protein OG770_27325 [Streptomyces sp. NBC_01185]